MMIKKRITIELMSIVAVLSLCLTYPEEVFARFLDSHTVTDTSLIAMDVTIMDRGKLKKGTLGELTKDLNVFYFWSTWCAPCLRRLPKLDSLQQVFSDSLAIIPIAREKNERISLVFNKNEHLLKLQFPLIIQATDLSDLFPHRGVPHVVWLDKHMNVLLISDEKAINEDTIRKLLEDR